MATREAIEPSFDHRTGNDGEGYYIRTFTGRKLYWDRVEEHDFCIEDIAHALAMKCRWSGHTTKFYSIAQHSVFTSYHVGRRLREHALLHDASEAYMPDFPSPLKWYLLKRGFTELKMIEKRVQRAINLKFNLAPTDADEKAVKKADLLALSTEHNQLMPVGEERKWMGGIWEGDLDPVGPAAAEQMFLDRWSEIKTIGKYEEMRV